MSRPKITISVPAPILPGSIGTVRARCGKKNCHCHMNKRKLHGPYFRWTGIIDGKHTGVALSPELFKECKRRIKNYRILIKKFDKVVSDALKNAPWK